MINSRLKTLFPSLVTQLESASIEKQKEAFVLACTFVVKMINLNLKDVDLALNFLQKDADVNSQLLKNQLENLALSFDDAYLNLTENEQKTSEMMDCFFKARAVSSIVYALSDSQEKFQEAIYELIAASENPQDVINIINEALAA